jgi:hypothetical protein
VVPAIADFFPDLSFAVQNVAALVDVSDFYRLADFEVAVIRFFLAAGMLKETVPRFLLKSMGMNGERETGNLLFTVVFPSSPDLLI